MATFKDVVKDVINESSNKYLKCFYAIDVHIDEANQQADNISAFQQVNPVAPAAPVAPPAPAAAVPASPGVPEVPPSRRKPKDRRWPIPSESGIAGRRRS